MKRILNGLKLFQNDKVHIDHEDDELIIFFVEGSRGEKYQVSIYDNSVLCDCDDYQYRAAKEPGSYLCKHCYAALIRLMAGHGFKEKLQQSKLTELKVES